MTTSIIVPPSTSAWQAKCQECGSKYLAAAESESFEAGARFRYCAVCGANCVYFRLDPTADKGVS